MIRGQSIRTGFTGQTDNAFMRDHIINPFMRDNPRQREENLSAFRNAILNLVPAQDV